MTAPATRLPSDGGRSTIPAFAWSARNGRRESRGPGTRPRGSEWTAFLDDDDVWAPRKPRTRLDAGDGAGASFAYAGRGDDLVFFAKELDPNRPR